MVYLKIDQHLPKNPKTIEGPGWVSRFQTPHNQPAPLECGENQHWFLKCHIWHRVGFSIHNCRIKAIVIFVLWLCEFHQDVVENSPSLRISECFSSGKILWWTGNFCCPFHLRQPWKFWWREHPRFILMIQFLIGTPSQTHTYDNSAEESNWCYGTQDLFLWFPKMIH